MDAKLKGIAIALALLAAVGGGAWVLTRSPPAADEKRASAPPGTSWMLLVGAVPGDERAVTVTLSARDAEGRPIASALPPTASARMAGVPAALPQHVELVADGAGSWRGAARLSGPGRWTLEVHLRGETVSLPFELAATVR